MLGTWQLDSISCYSQEVTDEELEKYEFPDTTATVTLIFRNNEINYEVYSSLSCTTSAVGKYITAFSGNSTGEMDFTDLITGSTCNLDVVDNGDNSVGTVSVAMTMLGTQSSNLDWEVYNDRENLDLDYFADFNGSTSVNGCSGLCDCTATFTRD